MTYAAKADMIALFAAEELVALTDRANPPTGAIDDGVLNRALADGSAEIDAYLAVRYDVPMSPAPAMLVGLACDIARYRLYDNAPTEIVGKRYGDAIRFLRDVAAGKASLGPDSTPPVSGGVSYSGEDRVFSRATMIDY